MSCPLSLVPQHRSGEINRTSIEHALAAAIDAESEFGWPGAEMAPIAFRQWSSFSRRHPKAKGVSVDDLVLDLAKGMQAHFEPDIPYTPLSDWLSLARLLAQILASTGGDAEPGDVADLKDDGGSESS